MRLAVVVLVACSCGSITPVSPLTSSDAGGESRLDTYQPDQTSQPQADAAGELGPDRFETAPPWPPAQCDQHPTTVTRCGTFLNGLECLTCDDGAGRFPSSGACAQSDGVCTPSCGGSCS